MKPYQIILLCAIVAALVVAPFAYYNQKRAKAEKAIERAATRATVAAAVDSATRARIRPLMDSLGRIMAGYKSEQALIKSTITLNARKNENLNKQIDSLNARLGVRPRF
jgi:hypothetical protein